MRNDKEIYELIDNGEIVYIKDEFLDVAIRLEPSGNAFLKYKGKKEHEVDYSNETVFEARIGGDIISKAEYEAY